MSPTANPAPPVRDDELVATKRASEVRGMFHAISPSYDFLNHLLSMNTDKRWRRFTARRVVNADMRDILDVCSGTGDLALALGRQAGVLGASPRIAAADFTPSMMERGGQKFAGSTAPGPRPLPLVGDTLRLPFSSASFDLVTVAFGIRNVADYRAGLREMARVCRPGGTIAVLEFSKPRSRAFGAIYNFYFFRVLPWIGYAITGTRAYRYLPKSVAAFPESDEFRREMTAAAGGATEAILLTFGIATLYTAKRR